MPEAIHVIVQYCNDPRQARQAEYEHCVRTNLANASVIKLHNLVEPKTVVPEEFRKHPKYVERTLDHWMTYCDALAYANQELAGEVVCLCNLDIFLDLNGDWDSVAQSMRANPKLVLCQSRMEYDPNGLPYKDPFLEKMAFANSQDAWIFLAPIEVPNCDFEIGTLGCDNAFAHRVKTAGYIPLNACDQHKIYHFDRARGKDTANQLDVHRAERGEERFTRHPEAQGWYYVPNVDQITSVDELIKQLDLAPLNKYMLICDILSKYLKFKNEY